MPVILGGIILILIWYKILLSICLQKYLLLMPFSKDFADKIIRTYEWRNVYEAPTGFRRGREKIWMISSDSIWIGEGKVLRRCSGALILHDFL